MHSFKDLVKVLSIVIVSLSQTCHSLYDKKSDVIELNPTNFESKVIDSTDIWIVEFFAPWCGHCKALVPEYTKAAAALKGVVKVGSVDADAHNSLGSRFGVRGFPTIKIFGANKKTPIDFNGARTAAGLIDAAFKELRRVVDSRVGGGSGGGSSSGGGGRKAGDKKDVVELTDANFEEKVLKSDDLWLVEFFAPWCGHCKSLEPIWAEAATELKGKVKVGALDATAHTITAGKYNIKGFPTIKMFASGKKDGSAEDYDGGRTTSDIVNWALDKVSESAPPPEVNQLINEDTFKACDGFQLCVISVLPHILDCQSKCRNEYIETLQKIGDNYKKNKWGYLWIEAMAQPEVEDALEIGGFGYPAMAVLNVRKMKYSLLRGSFSYDGINGFLRDLMYGRGSSSPIRGAKLPTIQTTEPWDGKDGQMPVVDEDIGVDHSEL
ncbi:unnamed protein product [Oppiella nova]|uniref:Protein disulfide-isomerase A6 homolog n=1 Tax=Oppiella nova TaxID=334625 RepID=A0A7R9LWS9_9ACAR|nr:unnamed protein product [Oppiella nova]CAG2167755.1 unnamed protein product [Oppiella nova]